MCQCAKSNECLRKTLEQEFGVFEGVEPHRQKQPPVMKRLETSTKVREYIAPKLDKPVTRGRITNIGENNALVRFVNPWGLGKPVGWEITEAVNKSAPIEGEIELLPGEPFNLTFPFEALEISPATAGQTVRVQVFAQ